MRDAGEKNTLKICNFLKAQGFYTLEKRYNTSSWYFIFGKVVKVKNRQENNHLIVQSHKMNMAYKLTVELSEDARARISDGFFNDPFSSGKATDQFCFCRGLPILSENVRGLSIPFGTNAQICYRVVGNPQRNLQ
jgi:hypothetical protein